MSLLDDTHIIETNAEKALCIEQGKKFVKFSSPSNIYVHLSSPEDREEKIKYGFYYQGEVVYEWDRNTGMTYYVLYVDKGVPEWLEFKL